MPELRTDSIMFCTEASDEGVADARAWVRRQGFTADDVRLAKRDGQVLVISRRPLSPKPEGKL